MKVLFLISFILGVHFSAAGAQDHAESLILLSETGAKNLRLKTEVAEERNFEKSVFAIGRVEEIPGRQHVLSSRIPGRAIEVLGIVGDHVSAGSTLLRIESRQSGNPPPVIELVAPRSGLIVKADVVPGQPVEPDRSLMTISDRTEVSVVASIPEQLAAGITIGSVARIRFPALASAPIEAEILRFGVNADASAGTIAGVFHIPNPGFRLQPGMRAECEIVVEQRSDVLAVPGSALQGDPASPVVYVKDFELTNAFIRAPVVTGQRGGDWVEILEGLFPGDEVVTRGSYALGYVGNNSGISLREKLDADHGHKHNEDGSELTPEQLAAEHDHEHADHQDSAPTTHRWLVFYAVASTLAALVLGQLLWRARTNSSSSTRIS